MWLRAKRVKFLWPEATPTNYITWAVLFERHDVTFESIELKDKARSLEGLLGKKWLYSQPIYDPLQL